MNKKEIADIIFNYIKDNKFTPYDIEYLDGYFIFNMGENSVVHFKIKGLYGWKFGIWLNDEDLQFFAQHKDNIDKFKPLRSYFCEEYLINNIKNDWHLYNIKYMLKMIKYHPMISFCYDLTTDKYCSYNCILEYIKIKYFNINKKIKEFCSNFFTYIWNKPKMFFINKYKIVNYAKLFDKNTEYFKVSPRYTTHIHFNKISDDELIQQNKEIKVLDTWFHKNYYKNMNLEITREGIKHRYSYEIKK